MADVRSSSSRTPIASPSVEPTPCSRPSRNPPHARCGSCAHPPPRTSSSRFVRGAGGCIWPPPAMRRLPTCWCAATVPIQPWLPRQPVPRRDTSDVHEPWPATRRPATDVPGSSACPPSCAPWVTAWRQHDGWTRMPMPRSALSLPSSTPGNVPSWNVPWDLTPRGHGPAIPRQPSGISRVSRRRARNECDVTPWTASSLS